MAYESQPVYEETEILFEKPDERERVIESAWAAEHAFGQFAVLLSYRRFFVF